MQSSTVTSRGQTTIPADIRKAYNLKVVSSNLTPATKFSNLSKWLEPD